MRIITEQVYDGTWRSVTDSFDGAPDAGQQDVGEGLTELEAINDLKEILTTRGN